MQSIPAQPAKKGPIGLALLRLGPRLVWSAGGLWERFFFFSIFLWTAYLGTLYLLASTETARRVSWVFFSYIALLEAWLTPIMSASVLRAMNGTGINQSEGDENARLLSEYLESLGHGGHWMMGNFLSLAYFGFLVAWAFIAFNFHSLAGISDIVQFGIANFSLVLLLAVVYHRLLGRFLRRARQAGYPIRFARRSWGK